MNNFLKSEIKGRALLKSVLDQIPEIEQHETDDKYNPVDYYFSYGNKNFVAEIKCRDPKYLDCETHIIESKKLNAITEAMLNNNCDNAYYINFFGDDIAYIYPIKYIKENGNIDKLRCNKTTAYYNGKTVKDILYIPVDDKYKIVRVNGIWKTFIDNLN